MKSLASLAASTALALSVGTAAFAQDTITGIRDLDDRIDDIDRDAQRDIGRANDASRFGQQQVPQGWRGSAAVTGASNSGNTSSTDLTFAGRLTYGQGLYTHLFGFGGNYGISEGDRSESSAFAIYEGSRDFGAQFYGFGTGRFNYDRFDTYARDAFVGAGIGYRIINTPDVAWRVQAGPGARYLDRNGNYLDDDGNFTESSDGSGDDTDLAAIISSRVFYGLSDTVSVTNDTDILTSDTNTSLINDFGVNFKVSNTFTTRISYRTDYDSDPAQGFKSTDNRIGLSLVVGF